MYWPIYMKLHTRCLHSPRGLRSGSAASRLLGLRVRILPRAWMFVSCDCNVLSGLRRADHSSRGVLLCAVRCVWSGTLTNVKALAPVGPLPHNNKYLHKMCKSVQVKLTFVRGLSEIATSQAPTKHVTLRN